MVYRNLSYMVIILLVHSTLDGSIGFSNHSVG